MRKVWQTGLLLGLLAALALCCGCESSDSNEGDGDLHTSDGDKIEGEAEIADGDEESAGEAETELGLPDSLNITYNRADQGTPLTDEEIKTFTRKILSFLKQVKYFDYVLYTTHGVDASTGKRDWQFWFGEHFKKEGDKVTFYHPVNLTDGGHNLHIPMSRVTGDVIAAYLLTDDATAALAAEKLCKGFSASMLGQVYDENDKLPHIMARNVVAFNHEFTTHDGKRKAVDYSGWFSDYERWNTNRFKYVNNPYWGEVWVTNMRSKDDVPHIFRLIPILRYAAVQAKAATVKDACGEALTLLEGFAKDIVDSDYRIRAKNKNGELFIPGYTEDKELNKKQGDLASFINYRDYIPNGECNARRSAELIGYHKPINEDCGRGEPNSYDQISFGLNSYNKRICRYFHVSHIANALVNRDDEAAEKLMSGLEERMTQEKALKEDEMRTEPRNYYLDLALYLAQSHAYGYPLTSEEARTIQEFYGRAVDRTATWPYWDPWASAVPDGELGSYRPSSCDNDVCWWKVEDFAQIFETRWSPFINPASARYVDCDIVRDPSKWDAD